MKYGGLESVKLKAQKNKSKNVFLIEESEFMTSNKEYAFMTNILIH